MKYAITLLRFACGILGGKWFIALWTGAIVLAYAALIYAATISTVVISDDSLKIEMGGMLATGAALGGVLALSYVRYTELRFPLWKLAPTAPRLTTLLMRCIGVVIAVSAIPAVVLRAYGSTRERMMNALSETNWHMKEMTLVDVPTHTYAAEALLLGLLATAVFIGFGRPRSRMNLAAVPIQMAALLSRTSSKVWWWPVALCIAIPLGEYVWDRWFGQNAVDRKRVASDRATTNVRISWLTRWRQAEAAKAVGPNAARRRVSALLTLPADGNAWALSTLVVAFYLVIQSSAFLTDSFVPWLLWYTLMLLVAKPMPLPLMRLALLPIGTQRKFIGTLIAQTWWRYSLTILIMASVLGITLRWLSWAIDWPEFLHSEFIAHRNVYTHLLWSPLSNIVGIFGIAVSMSLISSASPRFLAKAPNIVGSGFAGIVVLSVMAFGYKTLIQFCVPEFRGADAGVVVFALVNGVLVPVSAWGLHRALRYQWATAQLVEVSTAMAAWAESMRKMSKNFVGAKR